MAIELFQLKTTLDLNDHIWDTVTCKLTQREHFLCGPAHLSYDEFINLLEEWGFFIQDGRKETRSYLLPFPGLQAEGKPLGVFAKVYLGDHQAWRAQKEYDVMTYLGKQPITFPNMIVSKNFPSPRLVYQRLLLTPLVFSTPQLTHFCLRKINFYRTHFNISIDLDFAMPIRQKKAVQSNRQKVITHYKHFALDLFLRKQLELSSFTHGDAVRVNVVMEDGCNLVHRLTGVWPKRPATIGFQCLDTQTNQSLLIHSTSLPVLIDYDTVSFPSQTYPQSIEDYFSETTDVLKKFNDFDVANGYLDNLPKIAALARKCIVPMIAKASKPCCVRYVKAHEVMTPFVEIAQVSKSTRTFHALHTQPTPLNDHDTHELNTYLSRMSSHLIGVMRVFSMTQEDRHLNLDHIQQRISSLQEILNCKAPIYLHEYILPIQIK